MNPRQDVTALLHELGEESTAELTNQLTEAVYVELRGLALRFLGGERPDHTLQPTALVHEAYLRLVNQERVVWQERAHFLAVAAGAMRRVLLDHARRHGARKRGGGWKRIPLTGVEGPSDSVIDLLDFERALESLAREDERAARVVELKFFGGMTGDDVAHVLGVSPRTVKSDWSVAKLWLSRELKRGAEDEPTD
ncbi:MAG: RNA polymerase subunit sigma-70 [Candidatus Eisenbacteria bacterium]|uniref:RNA polymerase subunit sigma-70 n=1 Tax=Eiseniibacteriota bacterium TaxID=2212470 RepID=A0A956NI98_UNCEI|nr:RNA polymerase subunit sigma-70 [Candidatus Eisenbacteria bacterium]MCB9465165.1 RNA polymerase subunit sigma-70 [Candidatus Eisenbacteria bacterium]